ncbi:hypothetical protein E4U58_001473 [Claviceps cyperi]|nr:hypothetical protein E4U58_001473 [Claviceps cyperi]
MPTTLEVIQYYHVVHIEACRKHKSQDTKEIAVQNGNHCQSQSHSSTLESIQAETGCRQVSLREISKPKSSYFSRINVTHDLKRQRNMHKELLNDARWANTSPDKWIEKWNTVYKKAVRQDINKIKGTKEIQDFIQTVGAQFEPT